MSEEQLEVVLDKVTVHLDAASRLAMANGPRHRAWGGPDPRGTM